MTRNGKDHPRCSRCGTRCAARKLTTIGPAEVVCARCFDRLPNGVRNTLLRRVREARA